MRLLTHQPGVMEEADNSYDANIRYNGENLRAAIDCVKG